MEEKKLNIWMFIPIASMILFIICFFINKALPTSYTVTIWRNSFEAFSGLTMFLPMSGIPIGIIGLVKKWNKTLSIINIILGILTIIFITWLFFVMILGFMSLANMY